MRNILVTGGAGFIGSHVVRLFLNTYPEYTIYNLDKLTYAGDQNNNTIPERPICDQTGITLVDGLGDKIQSSSWLLKK